MTVTGDWNLEIEFLRGHARHALRLSQEGETLGGRYRSQFGESDVRGTMQGGNIEWVASIQHEHCGVTYRFHGHVEGDRMEGEVDLGEYWQARWQATRQA